MYGEERFQYPPKTVEVLPNPFEETKTLLVLSTKIEYVAVPAGLNHYQFDIFNAEEECGKVYHQPIHSLRTHIIDKDADRFLIKCGYENIKVDETHLTMSPELQKLFDSVVDKYKEESLKPLQIENNQQKQTNKILRKSIDKFNKLNWFGRLWFAFSGKTVKTT